MSHCRHLFSRGHIPQLAHHCLGISHRSSSNVAHAIPARIEPTRPNVLLLRSSLRRDATSKSTSSVLETSFHSTMSTSTSPDVKTPPRITTDRYQDLRARDPNLVSQLPTSSYLRVLDEATSKSHELANRVAMDIMEIYQGEDHKRVYMLRTILSRDFSALRPKVVFSILRYLDSALGGLHFLPSESVAELAWMVTNASISSEADRLLARLTYRMLIPRAASWRAPGGLHSLDYSPPRIIRATFGFMHKLLNLSCQEEALRLFQIMVETGHIPPETMQGLDSSSNDFKIIVGTALARASLHWNWRTLAITILTDLLDLPGTPHQSIIDLNLDTIHVLLDAPTRKDIRACLHLIRTAHDHAPVPHSIIRQFYISAAQLLAGDGAEGLYQFTRSAKILKQHRYPPPHGLALSWLMYHLTSHSRKTHLSRELASEVVNDNLPLPLQSRARFLINTAAQGYAMFARKLWERYSVGKDKHVVVGSSALMIRMISLFVHLRRRTRTPRTRFTHRNVRPVNNDNAQRQSEDFTIFLTQILQSYRAQHKPLVKAPHQVLTSLARAYFILGKFTEGLQTFKVLLQRKELPDMYDVNVALTAVAQVRPRFAARMIDRMIDKGLEPDAVTFGTVMHHALLHRDMELVNKMMQRIYSLQNAQLSLKSVAALVHASVTSGQGVSDHFLKTRLKHMLMLIKSLSEVKPLSSPQTGKYLVYTCLRAEEPLMAYEFWNLLLRESAVWYDNEQQWLRRRIATLIQQPKAGLDNDRVVAMLSKLGQ